MSNFDVCFNRLIGSEGKYTNNTQDRGNWTTGIIGKGQCKGTKYGIAAMSYPDLDIKNLTLQDAKNIYFQDFYTRLHCDAFHPALAFQLFDAAVQHNTNRAAQFLQQALGIRTDGVIGQQTIAISRQFNPIELCLKYIATRIRFYTSINRNTWLTFGAGWMNRMSDNLRYLAEDLK